MREKERKKKKKEGRCFGRPSKAVNMPHNSLHKTSTGSLFGDSPNVLNDNVNDKGDLRGDPQGDCHSCFLPSASN